VSLKYIEQITMS